MHIVTVHCVALQKQSIRLVDESGWVPGIKLEQKILIQTGIAYCAVHTLQLNI